MHESKGVAAESHTTASRGRNGNGQTAALKATAMKIEPYFCPVDTDPFDTVEWELRTTQIKDETGGVLFEQTDCEIPQSWSPLATNVVGDSTQFVGVCRQLNPTYCEMRQVVNIKRPFGLSRYPRLKKPIRSDLMDVNLQYEPELSNSENIQKHSSSVN